MAVGASLGATRHVADGRPARLVVWSVVAGLGVALALLAIAVAGTRVPSADVSVSRWVQGIDFPIWGTTLEAAEFLMLTGFPSGPLIWFGAVVGFWLARRRVEAFMIGISLAIWVPKTIIKEIVESPRPTDDLVAIHEVNAGFGFPSGHMTGGVAFWGMLAIVAVVLLYPHRSSLLAPLGIVALLTLASLNRIDTGAHWPSDVLGSLLLGGIWLSALTAVYLRLRRSRRGERRQRRAAGPQPALESAAGGQADVRDPANADLSAGAGETS